MRKQLSPIKLALASLLVATLGCGLPGRRLPDGPTPGFSTATPGGSVSVSLRTPGPQDPALTTLDPNQTTPIGPIATATALAAAASRATATAQALQSRTFYPPATCPEVGNPAPPERPVSFEEYPEAIARYLSLGGAASILEATLRRWYETDGSGQRIPGRDFASAGGLVRADRDFNADRVPEVLLVLPDPGSTRLPPSGDILMFACQDAAYRLLFELGLSRERSVPFVISADDLLDRGYNQLVYVTEVCDASTCRKDIEVWGWSLTLGTFVNMAADVLTVPGRLAEGLGASVTDTTGDNIREIVVSTGIETSPEAGPPRPTTQVWAWNGEVYSLSQSVTAEPVYRIHAIHDADAALVRGEFEQAAALYTCALTDPELQSWTLPNENQYLGAYALYRLMLTYAVQYDQFRAGEYFDQLLAAYPPFHFPAPVEGEEEANPEVPLGVPGGPGSIYAELASVFWDAFTLHNDHGLACQAAVSFAQARPEVLTPLNGYGYANPHYTTRDLCPFVTQ